MLSDTGTQRQRGGENIKFRNNEKAKEYEWQTKLKDERDTGNRASVHASSNFTVSYICFLLASLKGFTLAFGPGQRIDCISYQFYYSQMNKQYDNYCYLKKNLVLLCLIYKIRWALFRYYTVHCAANYPLWLWMCGRKYKSSYSKKRLFSCSLNYDLKSSSVSRSVVSNSLWPHGL